LVTWLVCQLKDFHMLHCMDLGTEEDEEKVVGQCEGKLCGYELESG